MECPAAGCYIAFLRHNSYLRKWMSSKLMTTQNCVVLFFQSVSGFNFLTLIGVTPVNKFTVHIRFSSTSSVYYMVLFLKWNSLRGQWLGGELPVVHFLGPPAGAPGQSKPMAFCTECWMCSRLVVWRTCNVFQREAVLPGAPHFKEMYRPPSSLRSLKIFLFNSLE